MCVVKPPRPAPEVQLPPPRPPSRAEEEALRRWQALRKRQLEMAIPIESEPRKR
jgi:hypothetical protein